MFAPEFDDRLFPCPDVIARKPAKCEGAQGLLKRGMDHGPCTELVTIPFSYESGPGIEEGAEAGATLRGGRV